MSLYPPFPIFTFVGFFVHSVVFVAMSLRFVRRITSRSELYVALGVVMYAIDFLTVLVLFFFFPNNLLKTVLFTFNAMVVVSFGSIFLIMSALSLLPRLQKLIIPFGVIAGALALYSFTGTLAMLLSRPELIEFAYVHPAYPKAISNSQGISGPLGGIVFALFFVLYGFRSKDRVIMHRSVAIGAGALLNGLGGVYWLSTSPLLYILGHTISPIGSIIVCAAIFLFKSSDKNYDSSRTN